MLVIEQLVCGYRAPDTEVVGATSLALPAGSFICVIGRNGAGKSTLMRTIAGLQPALSGHIELDGVRVDGMSAPDRARAISVVTTERVSSPGLLARDVVELGRQPFTDWQGRLTAADKDIVAGAIAQMGATHLAPKLFNSLSDGERQRIMIARALAQTSKIMILDEITAFLDLPGRVEVMAMLRRHAEEQKKIVLLSSHDLELSLELSGELWIVDGGRLTVGSADDLIAAGGLAKAFDSSDVVFDGARRRFVLRQSA